MALDHASDVTLNTGTLTLNTSFDATNFTFASVSSEPVAFLTMNSGTLSNLNDLNVGQGVTLNGDASWAPSGNIKAGSTILNNRNATLTTTGDLDSRVITFNAGTLVGGTISGLPTLSNNMTVDISSGGSLGTPTSISTPADWTFSNGTLSAGRGWQRFHRRKLRSGHRSST